VCGNHSGWTIVAEARRSNGVQWRLETDFGIWRLHYTTQVSASSVMMPSTTPGRRLLFYKYSVLKRAKQSDSSGTQLKLFSLCETSRCYCTELYHLHISAPDPHGQNLFLDEIHIDSYVPVKQAYWQQQYMI